jgi:hypothetical protein
MNIQTYPLIGRREIKMNIAMMPIIRGSKKTINERVQSKKNENQQIKGSHAG